LCERSVKKEKIINNLGEYNISINDNTITFDSIHGKINAPLLYKRNFNNFSFAILRVLIGTHYRNYTYDKR